MARSLVDYCSTRISFWRAIHFGSLQTIPSEMPLPHHWQRRLATAHSHMIKQPAYKPIIKLSVGSFIGVLLLLLIITPLSRGQTSITVQDPSFESGTPNPPSFGWYNSSVAGWACTGSGQWEPAIPSNFSSVPDGNAIIYMASGSCSQDLGIVPAVNSSYTLTVSVGHRVGNNLVSPYTLALNAGTTQLCSVSDTNSTIAQGAWITKTLTCPTGATVPSGNLTIVISASQNQAAFDNVVLTQGTAPPPPPPPHQAALTWTDTGNPAGTVTYTVLRASPTNGQCPAALNPTYVVLVSGLTVTNYTDTTIQVNTQYCYQVQAVANNQSGIAGIVLFVPGSVNTITVSAVYPWWYDKLVSPINTLKVS